MVLFRLNDTNGPLCFLYLQFHSVLRFTVITILPFFGLNIQLPKFHKAHVESLKLPVHVYTKINAWELTCLNGTVKGTLCKILPSSGHILDCSKLSHTLSYKSEVCVTFLLILKVKCICIFTATCSCRSKFRLTVVSETTLSLYFHLLSFVGFIQSMSRFVCAPDPTGRCDFQGAFRYQCV